MTQCVPSCQDLDDATSFPFHVPSLEHHELAELTWQNGHLASKPRAAAVAGTLESIVNQAAAFKSSADGDFNELIAPWFLDHRGGSVSTDALVPVREHVLEPVPGGGDELSTGVGSCSFSESTDGCRQFKAATFDTFTSTSVWSPENTSSGNTTFGSAEDHDSVCPSRLQEETADQQLLKVKEAGRHSVSTKRNRAARIHSQSERRRKDRIKQRMKTLQKMIPDSSKTDKASMLDEVMEYVKQLEAQLQVMTAYMTQMMVLQQSFNMSMMGIAGVMDLNTISHTVGMPSLPIILPAAGFMPMASWPNMQGHRLPSPNLLSPLLPSAAGIDAYGRLAARYQQFQQPYASKTK